jgi:hypothetical protein
MFRLLLVTALCAGLGGCGLAARKEREEAFAAAKARTQTALADCEAKYPQGSKQPVEKAQCMNAAFNILRPFVPYPDLMDQDMANRALLAEKVQQGKLSPAEATAEMTQRQSQIVAEEQRRGLANRAVSAQESAAAAAWKGTSCTRIGDTVNCF